MQHTITALVENRPGVLARVTGLFARRGFNIESLAVSITEDPTVSRMTLVVALNVMWSTVSAEVPPDVMLPIEQPCPTPNVE